MALTLESTTSGAQGIQNRLGPLNKALLAADTFRGTTMPGLIEDLQEVFDGGTAAVRRSIEDVFSVLDDLQGVDVDGLAALAEQILIDMTNANNPLPDRTLATAMDEFIRELKAQSYKVASNTVSASATQSGLTGNGEVIISTKNPQGIALQNLIPEDLEVRVLSPTSLQVLGEDAENDLLSHNWPQGSGAAATYTPVLPDSSDSLVTNGSFDAFTTNVPDGWTVGVGTPGTTVGEEASTLYRSGGKALKITGNGSQLTAIYQDLVTVLEPHTQYALAFMIRMDSDPAAGALKVSLHDGSVVINDEAAAANELAFTLTTGLSSGWVRKTAVFRTPDPLPAACRLQIELTTALTNSRVCRIDDLTLSVMSQPSGDDRTPYLQFVDGSTPYSIDDNAADGSGTFKIAVANDFAGVIQKAFLRLFNMYGLGRQLPITGTNTLDASLFS